ncbi:FimV/HubP family polar landmark protein [Neisseria wadsworthii]|uniref:FimV/HubP family polar landmark protein n=1 Tax=Neisseria wadsworthii TaxID=607711 RepID=UPI00131A6FEB|nr:FimV/HubP family polar landmark protein [Neisseria wadsworthii]
MKIQLRGQVLKINSRIKLIALSVSMIVSLGAVAAPETNMPDASAKQEKGHYTVRQGETLAQIAARFRPADTSLNETIRALVKANPRAFKNGNINFIRAGEVLVIPSSLELSKLDGQPAIDKRTAPPASDSAASQVKQFPAIVPVEPKTLEPVKPVEVPKPVEEKKPVEIKASENVPAKPVQKAEEVVAPKTASAVQPSAASAEVAKTTQLTQAEQADKEKAEALPPVETEGKEKSRSSLLWVVLLGIGLLGLFIFNKMKGNKKLNDVFVDESLKEPEPIEKTTQTVAPVAGAAAVSEVKDEEESIFFSDVEQAKQPKEVPAGEVDIDLSALDDQGGIVSSAVTNDEETNKRRDADWDEIESTDSIYEEEPTSVKVEAEEDIVDVEVAVSEDDESSSRIADAEEGKHAPLEFDLPEESAHAEVAEEVIEETEEALAVEASPISKEVDAAPKEVETALTATTFESSVVSEGQVEEQLEVVESVQTVEKQKAEDTHTFPASEVELEAQQVEIQPEDDEGPLSLDQSGLVVEAGDVAAEEDFSNTHITEADDDTVIEWDSVQFGDADGNVGFVSESVGMTAPLEAKYELAQMYIEIGDPDAARETLNELVEEASGDILAKSKALLAELG